MAQNSVADSRHEIPRPTLDQALALLEVAKFESYDDARRELGLVSASSIYHLVARLEDALGRRPLLTETRKGRVRLTAVGREVLPQVEAFVQAHRAFAVGAGSLRFSCYPVLAGRAAATILGFAAEHPKFNVIYYDVSDELRRDRGASLVSRAASGEIDLVVAPDDNERNDLAHLPLYRWQLRLFVSDTDPFRRRETVTIAELAGRPLLLSPPGHLSRRLFERTAAEASVHVTPLMQLLDQHVLRKIAAASTNYIAVIPDDAFDPPSTDFPLLLDVRGMPIEGRYELYYSKRHERAEADGSKRASAVIKLAKLLQEALKDELDPKDLLPRAPNGSE